MYALELPVGTEDATVAVFSPDDAENNGLASWSLKHLQRPADMSRCHLLARKLAENLRELDISSAFAPHVAAASGRIVTTKDLSGKIPLGKVHLHRNPNLPADGVLLGKGEAFVMSSSGCPVILATAGNDFVVAHAGRDSLIDRGAVMRKPTRKHVSVVNAIIEKLRERGAASSEIVMVLLFSIPAKEFQHSENHPQYGKFNRALTDYVDARWPCGVFRKDDETYLDLEQVFVEQARQDGIRQCWAGHSLSKYPFLSHTRDGKDVERRNLVVVKRN